MLLIYLVLGRTAFASVKPKQPLAPKLWIRAKGVTASGYDTPAGFIVTRGSQAAIDWVPSAHEYAKDLRDWMRQERTPLAAHWNLLTKLDPATVSRSMKSRVQ